MGRQAQAHQSNSTYFNLVLLVVQSSPSAPKYPLVYLQEHRLNTTAEQHVHNSTIHRTTTSSSLALFAQRHSEPAVPNSDSPYSSINIMKKFGFGKKGGDGDDDSSRSALFGSRSSKNSSPAPAASNPYAQPPQAADPYAQDNNKYANMGPVGPSGASSPAVNRGPSPGGYAAEKYGSGGGYGSNRYD